MVLKCLSCGHHKTTTLWCKRKWCPCCARRFASQRSAELQWIVERFRYPLFVTLTMKNVDDLSKGGVRHLRRSFGKLRHRKLWKARVAGGVACVEVTNIGNGWHPHLHAVLDCRWLAWRTPEPNPRLSQEEKKARYSAAACELERAWSKCLGQQSSSVKVKRCNRHTIAKEVVKYTVKNEDLVLAEGTIGDLIRALDSTRMMTTFGNAHGQKIKDIRLEAKRAVKAKNSEFIDLTDEGKCCGGGPWVPEESQTRVAREAADRRSISGRQPPGRRPLVPLICSAG
jgi:hypothetical protein